MLSCYIDSGMSPINLDEILFGKLLGETEPAAQQLEAIRAKAEQQLSGFGLGTWAIAECRTVQQSGMIEHGAVVTAVPVLGGSPILADTAMNALRNEQGSSPVTIPATPNSSILLTDG